jgi:hypothetical protein
LTDTWMTYTDAAQRLGIKVDSVRRTARAKAWQRRTMNDGTVQVCIPADRLPDVRTDILPDNPPSKSAPLPDESAIEIARLEERLHAAHEMISELRSQRDAWQAKATSQEASQPHRRSLIDRIFGR